MKAVSFFLCNFFSFFYKYDLVVFFLNYRRIILFPLYNANFKMKNRIKSLCQIVPLLAHFHAVRYFHASYSVGGGGGGGDVPKI